MMIPKFARCARRERLGLLEKNLTSSNQRAENTKLSPVTPQPQSYCPTHCLFGKKDPTAAGSSQLSDQPPAFFQVARNAAAVIVDRTAAS
jgi:hypothetical protein